MSTKVKKSFFKPLKYFSHMFEKEPEMQIGLPTDVKHVAHIGCDGANVASPSWMKDYHAAPVNSSSTEGRESQSANGRGSQECSRGGIKNSPLRQSPSKSRLSSPAPDAPSDSLDLNPTSTTSKKSKRHQSVDGSSLKDSTNGPRRNRKPRKKEANEASSETLLTQQDLPDIPKQSNRRRTKCSDSSAKPTKSKVAASSDANTEESNTQPSSPARGSMVREDD